MWKQQLSINKWNKTVATFELTVVFAGFGLPSECDEPNGQSQDGAQSHQNHADPQSLTQKQRVRRTGRLGGAGFCCERVQDGRKQWI